jgi:hypothetical protein
VPTSILYATYLFFLACGDKCACAIIGDRCVFSVSSKYLLSTRSGASIISLLSSGTCTLLNLVKSITLLRYPNAKLTVTLQLSCSCFHPCVPPYNYTLLRYSHSFLSASVYYGVGLTVTFCAHVTLGVYS